MGKAIISGIFSQNTLNNYDDASVFKTFSRFNDRGKIPNCVFGLKNFRP